MGKNRRAFASGKMGSSRILKGKDYVLALGIGVGITMIVAWLFYDSFWGMLSGILIIPLIFSLAVKEKSKKYFMLLGQEFKEYLYLVGSTMMAGYSPERAFITAKEELKALYGEDSLLAKQLSGLERRLGVKEPLENILKDFALNSRSEDIQNFVEIFCYAKRSGGDFLHIIQTSINRICDKMEVSQEIHMVMAEKALEEKVMSVVPIGILLFFRLTSPDFIEVLYGNLLGVCLMSLALLLYGVAIYLAQRVVEIEV